MDLKHLYEKLDKIEEAVVLARLDIARLQTNLKGWSKLWSAGFGAAASAIVLAVEYWLRQ